MTKWNENLRSLKSAWYVWLFPFFALCICGWLFFKYVNEKGPRIQISFEDGGNIQAEKTQVRFRGVPIGTVREVKISEDLKRAVVEVDLQRKAEGFAVEGSKFWLVSPKVTLQGVTGLETILEGPYIAVTPGKSEGARKMEFRGGMGTELEDPLEDTSVYWLETASADSVGVGDPVTFRGFKVGAVSKIGLAKTAQAVQVQINIENKYVKLIRENTVFWQKAAVQAQLGLFKSEVKISSLESMLKGGVEFFTPTEAGPVATGQKKFPLLADPPEKWQEWNPNLEL
ncbi:MAG: MlaD family protein [Bdellovibrio sp.]